MSNLSYWERRQVDNMFHYMEKAEDTADQISQLYLKASRWMSIETEKIFEKYKTKHNLTEAEARKLLNSLQDPTSLEEMLFKIKSADYKDERKGLIAKLESSAYQARIEHFKQLQNQLDYIMKNIYDQEKMVNTNHYLDLANEAYYRAIYDMQQRAQAAFSFNHIDSKIINNIVNSKWSGENYSSRIWKNTRGLAKDLKEELLINLVTGRTDREVADILANKFAQGANTARRLVRTESAYLSTELNFRAYEDMGVQEYQFLATLDLKTSEKCRKMDLKIFTIKERIVGVNCPPLHPWCRSTTVAIISRKFLENKQRAAIDPVTGKRISVPRNMSYDEWYSKYVKGNPKALLQEKKTKNHSTDKKQHEEYRKTLGDEVPEKLDDFQNMKYTDNEKWEYTKGLKNYLAKYPTSNKHFYDIKVELGEAKIKVGLPLPPVQKQAFILPEGKQDPYHIMRRMIERKITDDEIRSFMSEAKCMFIQWGGARQCYVSEKGMVVITKTDSGWIYKTAWKREDYDSDANKIMEVLEKHGL